MTREDLDHPTTQAFRVREATRGIYNHAKEQCLRVRDLCFTLDANDPFFAEWRRLQDSLEIASANLKAANDLAHVIGSRASALREQGRPEYSVG